MDHEERAALIADDPALIADHKHVIALMRAHRHLVTNPGRLRDWYLTRLADGPTREALGPAHTRIRAARLIREAERPQHQLCEHPKE
ncbi:hypothetical protein [Rhodococcus sp. SORGH_AS_0301]|uniref:hypothetical protein n=1 Tax=Rhodococcus sp. SORGH_AS_0301 TaxID=3041780 RepID=UPI002782933E|nr:hypothetical protein [Rhodococcus sp. SORGH_AS_0301]MDQ1178669.1 hypothetical protein [Rhodococcus sp. SORGH_AS_0301]